MKSQQNSPTITIGIPAYNEAGNIGNVLSDIQKQVLSYGQIISIVVHSDKCTDDTEKIVSNFPDPRLKLCRHAVRSGKAVRINDIFMSASTDIVIILDADIRLMDASSLQLLIEPIVKAGADLTSCPIEAYQPNSEIAKALSASMRIKQYMYNRINNGDNVYTCHGTARAFSKALYRVLRFESSVSEDAYSYFFCKKHNYKYAFAEDAIIEFRLPENLSDHSKQSARFIESKHILTARFGNKLIEDAYHLPFSIMISSLVRFGVSYPKEILEYLLLYVIILIRHSHVPVSDKWEPALTSKQY